LREWDIDRNYRADGHRGTLAPAQQNFAAAHTSDQHNGTLAPPRRAWEGASAHVNEVIFSGNESPYDVKR
jgi:hypothetical protein